MARGSLLLALIATLLVPAAAEAALPGHNGKLAFDSPVPEAALDRRPQVFTVDPDGSDLTQITFEGLNIRSHSSPAWSPDGSQIAVNAEVGLSVMNADGSGLHRVSSAPDGFPRDWSQDGLRILFAARIGGGPTDLLSMGLDGTDLRNHTQSGTDEGSGSWSPDGERIVFGSGFNAFANRSDLWTVRTDGTEDRVRLTDTTQVLEDDPDWSPDGSRIAFAGAAVGSRYEIFTMRADGSDVVQVTHNSTDDFRPQWSPDGTRIAFLRQDTDSNLKLWVMDAGGSDEQKVSDLEVYNRIDWQPLPNRPPDCSAVRATPAALGAPNHRLVAVTLSGASDPDGDAVDIEITGVTQDEPVAGPPDAVATTIPHRVRLRAERDPRGDGRVYRIAFAASDARGGTCTGLATAGVRKGGGTPVDSAPPSHDSFGS